MFLFARGLGGLHRHPRHTGTGARRMAEWFICRFRPRESYELRRGAAQTMEAMTDWLTGCGVSVGFVFPQDSVVCCGILGFGIEDGPIVDSTAVGRCGVVPPVSIPRSPFLSVPRPDLGPWMDALCAGRPWPWLGEMGTRETSETASRDAHATTPRSAFYSCET